MVRPKTSVMVNLRCTLSRRTPWAITCGWCGTCSAVRVSQGRSYFTGRASIAFALMLIGTPQLVQADGEVIGHTPVEIQMVPKAVHVIMPKPAEGEP